MRRLLIPISISIFIWTFIIGPVLPTDSVAAEPEKSSLLLDLSKDTQITKIESSFKGKGEERAWWIEVTIKNLAETPRIYNAEILLNDIHNFTQKTGKPLEPGKEVKISFASYLLTAPADKIYLKIVSGTP